MTESSTMNEFEVTNRLSLLDKNMKGLSKHSKSQYLILFLIYFSPVIVIIFLILFIVLSLYFTGSNQQALAQNIFNSYSNYITPVTITVLICSSLIVAPIGTYITYKRTHYKGFLAETIFLIENFSITILTFFIAFSQIGGIFLPLCGAFYVFVLPWQFKKLKKPLIHDSFKKIDSKNNPDILVKQSLYINSFKDGYSSRPLFENASIIADVSENKEQLIKQLEAFAKFLCLQGDLIGYDITDNILQMYLRTTLIQKFRLFDFYAMFKRVRQIIKKDKLTAVSLNLNTLEMSFRLNKYDYEIYGNITYLELSERIIKQFIDAIREFRKENYDKAYEIINPPLQVTKKVEELFIEQRIVKNFSILLYVAGMIVVYISAIQAVLFDPQSLFGSLANSIVLPILMILWPLGLIIFSLNNYSFTLFYVELVMLVTLALYVIQFTWKKASNYKNRKFEIM